MPGPLPVKWTALAAALVGWQLLLLPMLIPLLFAAPGASNHLLALYAALAPLSLFAFVLAVKILPPLQRAILREGHAVAEIAPALNTLIVLSGVLLAACICVMLTVP